VRKNNYVQASKEKGELLDWGKIPLTFIRKKKLLVKEGEKRRRFGVLSILPANWVEERQKKKGGRKESLQRKEGMNHGAESSDMTISILQVDTPKGPAVRLHRRKGGWETKLREGTFKKKSKRRNKVDDGRKGTPGYQNLSWKLGSWDPALRRPGWKILHKADQCRGKRVGGKKTGAEDHRDLLGARRGGA